MMFLFILPTFPTPMVFGRKMSLDASSSIKPEEVVDASKLIKVVWTQMKWLILRHSSFEREAHLRKFAEITS
jgi:hypothetical protein